MSFFAIARLLIVAAVAGGSAWSANGPANAAMMQDNIERYRVEAKALGQGFEAFSAERGRILFSSSPAAGKPDTPSCTACHTTDPAGVGQTRAGKEIAPMALSRTPDRYIDVKKIEKWFRRNCNSVLGRECTPLEKGDFLTFMASQ
ncbi:MAG: DUF1924 domain-containing protein [Rhodospirillaceae bacterium]|jgi:hypothetical protein|nr:DUF1924 domain-containing protein [Rhodospirillaceae bacterium]MBT5038494.1 DUF1924 domain-containing protein [Rhodospirillaceae bacterium]MBT5676828.1 DUF1924 domain-containing protein [Rhodospirillaceae bacterium]MBT5781379.1 DUF1924 domain-containing protein [Rhodospirillaceae bacterium]MBT7292772.1 DUF1924 domain-containing protein [Rhodospirillaceae bacterium]